MRLTVGIRRGRDHEGDRRPGRHEPQGWGAENPTPEVGQLVRPKTIRPSVSSVPTKPSAGLNASSPKSTSASSAVPPTPSGPTPKSTSKLAPPESIRFDVSSALSVWKSPKK